MLDEILGDEIRGEVIVVLGELRLDEERVGCRDEMLGVDLREEILGTVRREEMLGVERRDERLGVDLREEKLGVDLREEKLGVDLREEKLGVERDILEGARDGELRENDLDAPRDALRDDDLERASLIPACVASTAAARSPLISHVSLRRVNTRHLLGCSGTA
jgi:hypothetical protein